MATEIKGPYLGMKIPEDLCFKTDAGDKCFRDYKGKWLLLFSHPADFTPVCTTEFVAFSRKYEEFKKRGVELLGLSVDTNYSHIEWKRQIEQAFGVKVPFPIIADVDMKVASIFNAVPPGQNLTVRTVALIDPDLRLAWFAAYPYTNGRKHRRDTAHNRRHTVQLQVRLRHAGRLEARRPRNRAAAGHNRGRREETKGARHRMQILVVLHKEIRVSSYAIDSGNSS
jgi:alkyl hydroperoxide reductase subunit AhpC